MTKGYKGYNTGLVCRGMQYEVGKTYSVSGNYSKVATSGNDSQVATSGNFSKVATSGEHSVSAAVGPNSLVKGSKGSLVCLVHYNDKGVPVKFVTSKIGLKKTPKEDTWYTLDDRGSFVEAPA